MAVHSLFDEGGYSIFAGNLVTSHRFKRTSLEEDKRPDLMEGERELGRKVYLVLAELLENLDKEGRATVRISKRHPKLKAAMPYTKLDTDSACVLLNLGGYCDGEWRSHDRDTSPNLSMLATRLREAAPYDYDRSKHRCNDIVSTRYGGGAFYYESIGVLADAVAQVAEKFYGKTVDNSKNFGALLESVIALPERINLKTKKESVEYYI